MRRRFRTATTKNGTAPATRKNSGASKIPLPTRIFAVIDVWDALRSDRPYRRGWPEERVPDHIRAQRGKHFEPAVVDAALSVLKVKP